MQQDDSGPRAASRPDTSGRWRCGAGAACRRSRAVLRWRILAPMTALLDAFWRATAYCLHPRVILWSLLPLLLASSLALVVGYYHWEAAVSGVRAFLEGWSLVVALLDWLDAIGAGAFRAVLAPLIVVALAVPVIVVVSLLLVTLLMTPPLVSLVARRRFPLLERRRGASMGWAGLRALGLGLVALVATALTVPLWFVPPLVLLLPPLIWGWLAWRVLGYDVLAVHADADERRALLAEHRWPLLGMGLVAGYLGAAPSLLWALGAATLIFAPLLVLVSVWLYTLVFAFCALWFAHYLLTALQARRAEHEPQVVEPAPAGGPSPPLIEDISAPQALPR